MPSGWTNSEQVSVSLRVTDPGNLGWKKIQYQMGGGWKNISDALAATGKTTLTVSENGTLTVHITDPHGHVFEESAEINLLFILLCNGDVDTKLPPNVGDLGSDNTPGCFDWLAMAWLHEWDPSGRFARYGIVNELKDLEICRKSQLDSMKSVVEIIKRKNCP